MANEEASNCINCGSPVNGTYCNECGQPANPERLTFLTLINDYFGRVFSLDTRFLRTVKDLTVNPGKVSREFVLGNRVRYVPPVSYFVILITLFILFLSAINLNWGEMLSTAQQDLSPNNVDDKSLRIQQWFNDLFVKNMRSFFFLQIPFVALWGKIIFRKSGYNFLENGVLAFYTHGHLIWLGLFSAISYKLAGEAFNAINFVMSTIYFSWSCIEFYKNPPIKGFLKGFVVHILMLISYVLIIIIILIAGVFIYVKFIDPEFLNNL